MVILMQEYIKNGTNWATQASLLPSLETYFIGKRAYVMWHINFQVTPASSHWPLSWTKLLVPLLLLLQAQLKQGQHATSVDGTSSTNRLWSAIWTGIDRYASLTSVKCAIRLTPLWLDYTTTARRMAPLHGSSATFAASTLCTAARCTSMSISCMQLHRGQPRSRKFLGSVCCCGLAALCKLQVVCFLSNHAASVESVKSYHTHVVMLHDSTNGQRDWCLILWVCPGFEPSVLSSAALKMSYLGANAVNPLTIPELKNWCHVWKHRPSWP